MNFVLLPFRLLRRFATVIVFLLFLGSAALNMAILTVSGVYAAASSALSAVGVTTVAAREAGARLARRDATRKIGSATAQKVTGRVQRGAARSLASVGGEAIPFVGIGILAYVLKLEIDDACATAADMAGLEAALAAEGDPEEARRAAIENFDCRTIIPDFDQLPGKDEIWNAVRSAPRAALDRVSDYGLELGDRASDATEWIVRMTGSLWVFAWGEEATEN